MSSTTRWAWVTLDSKRENTYPCETLRKMLVFLLWRRKWGIDPCVITLIAQKMTQSREQLSGCLDYGPLNVLYKRILIVFFPFCVFWAGLCFKLIPSPSVKVNVVDWLVLTHTQAHCRPSQGPRRRTWVALTLCLHCACSELPISNTYFNAVHFHHI